MARSLTYIGVSPRAGVGATSTLLNLANNVKDGLRTLYVDLDAINPGGTSLLELENRPNILEQNTPDNSYIYSMGNFEVMPLYLYKSRDMSTYLEKEDETALFLINKIRELEKDYDVIFVDTPPGYMRTAIKTWQRFENLIGFGNYDIQSLSSLLQVMDIFKEWGARNLTRTLTTIVFTDIGTNKRVHESVLKELYSQRPIHAIPHSREFYSSAPLVRNDSVYLKAVKKLLASLNISPG